MSESETQAQPLAETVPLSPTVPPKDPKFTPLLNAALAKAQGDFVQPEKNKIAKIKNAQGVLLYETKYADLKNVIESFRVHLSKNGLAFTQKTVQLADRAWRLVLTLRHSSGEYDETAMPIIMEQGPQQVGGALTYLKRYQAAAYFGIAADDDDDGNAAQNDGKKADLTDKPPKPPVSKPASKPNLGPKGVDAPQGDPVPPKDPVQKAESDLKEKTGATVPRKGPPDPGVFVLTIGENAGKMLRDLNEKTLIAIRDWTAKEMKKTPPAKGLPEIMEINRNVKAFLKEVGVES